ncbi:MAG: glycosyltransferase family 2 protein [Clostridia bacterium]
MTIWHLGWMVISDLSIAWLACVDGLYFFLLLLSVGTLGRRGALLPLEALRGSAYVPPVSILVPAFNEAVTITASVEALLALEYPVYEVVVVNDGSRDDTLAVLEAAFDLVPVGRQAVQRSIDAVPPRTVYQSTKDPRLIVVDKENSGKGSSLNTAINYAQYPLVCTIDADSLLDGEALLYMARTYIEDSERTVAIGGLIRIANGCRIRDGRVVQARVPTNPLALVQTAEYLKTFIAGRVAWSAVNGLVIISGAFGIFRRDMMVNVGGYSAEAPGEDMEIVLKIHRYCREHHVPYRVAFSPDAVCWTQAPETLAVLGAQRRRWGRGNLRNVRNYRFMALRSRYRAVGLLALPYLIGVELFAPYVMVAGLLIVVGLLVGQHFPGLIWLLLLAGLVLDYMLGATAVVLDDLTFRTFRPRDVAKLLLTLLHMPVWYYFVTAVWRVQGHIQMLRHVNPWGTMTRSTWGQ